MIVSLLLAAAAPFADPAALDRAVAWFTGVETGAPDGGAMPVDRRLRLRACQAEPVVSWHGARRDAVVVQCPDPGGWRLFVPVAAGPGAPIAANAINRGDALTIAVSGEGFAVSQPGEALEGGPVGAWIRVRRAGAVAATSEALRARVVRPGLAEVPLP